MMIYTNIRWTAIRPILTALFFALNIGNNVAAQTDKVGVPANHHTVIILNFEFKPNQLKVLAGDSITWINKDIVPHNIALPDNKTTLSPYLKSGEKFTTTANQSLSYICGLHPSMKGKINIVNANTDKKSSSQ